MAIDRLPGEGRGMKYTAFFLWKTTILQLCGVALLFEYRLHTKGEP
jgi:hypothetical protein